MIKAVILDDSLGDIYKLKNLILQHSKHFMIETFTQIKECKDYLSTQRVDVLFLDIEIENRKGFEVVDYLDQLNKKTLVVYVSNFPSYALECINYRTLYFIQKPQLEEKIVPVIHKIERFFIVSQQAISVTFRNKTKDILLIHIVWIRKDINRLEICHYDGTKYIVETTYSTLGAIEEQLNDFFIKINRGDIINLAQIENFDTEQITLLDGTRFPISKPKSKDVALAYALYKANYKL